MKYKILTMERSFRGGKFKKPLRIRIPERQNLAERKVLQYILESLSRRSCLVSFTLNNSSTMKVARHLLFNKTGSPLTLNGYIDDFYSFCSWMRARPDQLMKRCRNRNGDANPKGICRMTTALNEYIDHLQARNQSPSSIKSQLKNVTTVFHLNRVSLNLPCGLSAWKIYEERAPSREELQKVLDIADLRERVIITALAVSGLRVGTFVKLQYRHVKNDLEHGIIPIHVHIEAGLTKAKRRGYDTFLNDEASDCLKAYFTARRRGTRETPPEQIRDESPLVRARHCLEVKELPVSEVQSHVHDLYIRAGLLQKSSSCKRYELRTHSLRKFFRTQMASLEVDPDCIDFMMGRTVKDRYHDVSMKGVEYLRGVYMTSGIRIRPKIKMNKIDALKEILQTWGLNPQKILTREALAQVTPATKQEQADSRDLVVSSESPQNHQPSRSLQESTGVQT